MAAATRSAGAQVSGAEIFHDEIGMLVAHAEVVEAHNVRMGDAAHDLVLLQEAPEGLIELVLLFLIARDLQHDERACLLALRQIQIGDAAACELTDAAIAAHEGAAEALRVLRIGGGAPVGSGDGLFFRSRGEDGDQLAVLDVGAIQHPLRAKLTRLARTGLGAIAAQENNRRKSRPPRHIAQPVKSAPVSPAARDQDGIKTLREKLGRNRALRARSVDIEACIRPAAARVVQDERTEARIVLDHQEAHLRPITRSPTLVPVGPV